MSDNSSIEWTEASWSCLAGCTWASPGCDNCYAATMTRRLEAMGQSDYAGLATRKHFNGVVRPIEHKLSVPLRWKKPRLIFVNSMSDVFHKDVPFEFVDKVFCVMNATATTLPASPDSRRWHTYQVLTKRPYRMAEYMLSRAGTFPLGEHPLFRVRGEVMGGHGPGLMNAAAVLLWPPDNVWLGTSIENQEQADERLPHLLHCPAAVRFVSAEPLLGNIDITAIRRRHAEGYMRPLDGRFNKLDWVIVGCESGPHRRTMKTEWAESLADQCSAAGVPFFMKQMEIDGKVCHDLEAFPETLRRREFPQGATP